MMNGPNESPMSAMKVVLTPTTSVGSNPHKGHGHLPASFIIAICSGLGGPIPAGGPLMVSNRWYPIRKAELGSCVRSEQISSKICQL
jgi:hypothetical protein